MANPAKQNRNDVIEKATHLFWQKGFHATSMRNLQDHIDMRPGSIYASFGSKEGLFKETLQCYAATSLQRLAASMEETSSPLEGLKAFITSTVLNSREAAPNEMCMLVKTVSELTEENAEILAEAKRLLHRVEDAFTAILTQAQTQGEISQDRDVRRLARFLQMQLIGLRVYVRANDDAKVNQLIDDAFACIS